MLPNGDIFTGNMMPNGAIIAQFRAGYNHRSLSPHQRQQKEILCKSTSSWNAADSSVPAHLLAQVQALSAPHLLFLCLAKEKEDAPLAVEKKKKAPGCITTLSAGQSKYGACASAGACRFASATPTAAAGAEKNKISTDGVYVGGNSSQLVNVRAKLVRFSKLPIFKQAGRNALPV